MTEESGAGNESAKSQCRKWQKEFAGVMEWCGAEHIPVVRASQPA